jgi:hypothetical protein
MWQRYSALLLILTSLLAGCSNLKKSVEQRVAISEQCKLATSLTPIGFQRPGPLASIQLGNIGYCNLSKENLLPMCSLDQIVTKYEIVSNEKLQGRSEGSKDEARTVTQTKLQDFEIAVGELRQALRAFAAEINRLKLDDRFVEVAATVVPGAYDQRTAMLEKWMDQAVAFKDHIRDVRMAQKKLRERMQALGPALDEQAKAELAAWDANLRFQLSRLEQVLAGDYTVVIQEGIKDQVLTHVARRTLDLLHGSLKASDVVLRQLDKEAYGAVSIGYLAFGPHIQDAVDKAFKNIVASYRQRQLDKAMDAQAKDAATLGTQAPSQATIGKVGQTSSSTDIEALTKPLLRELRRAACDNLLQGTEFSMLTELVDTMIIRHVEPLDQVFVAPVREASTGISVGAPGASILRQAQIQASAMAAASAPAEFVQFSVDDGNILVAAAQPGVTPPTAQPPAAVTPAGVHMTHAWVARQQMLVQAIQAKLGGAGKRDGFPGIETVDESAVQRLADAATAKAIDDAARLDPAMLGAGPTGVSTQLRNNVNVVTAATAVSQAAAVMKVNLSVSNVNTFNPTNYNNITPVINLTVPPAASIAPSLCAAGDFGRSGALCSNDENGLVISLAKSSFRTDSCATSDLEPALSAIGRRIADYRARYGIEHVATIEGYASLPKARLAGCREVARAPEKFCKFTNHLRHTFTVEACETATSDRNLVLSAARAHRAARVLEVAGQGAVTVGSLVAKGTETAQLRGGPPAADQTIVIRLQPRTP